MATPDQDQKPESAGEGGGEEAAPRASNNGGSTTAIRYGAMNWVGEFWCPAGVIENCGAKLVIESERGIELGQQLELTCAEHPHCVSRSQMDRYLDNSGAEFCRPRAGRVLRQATPQDVEEHRRLNAHSQEDVTRCAELAATLGLNMRVVMAEHLLGGERIVFYFRSDGRIDFRELVKELARGYRTRIEMRQVGARDEARLVADWEVCGRECCCKNFLKTLRPVNMKMAKLQKSTLDPAKVSGRCGRLHCCLRYEHIGYLELQACLPRRGLEVTTPQGDGTVIDTQVLTQLVHIRTADGRELTVGVEEVQPLPPESKRQPAPPEDPPGARPEISAAPPPATPQDEVVEEVPAPRPADQGDRRSDRGHRRRPGSRGQPRQHGGNGAPPENDQERLPGRPQEDDAPRPSGEDAADLNSRRGRHRSRRRRQRRGPPPGGAQGTE